MNRVSVLLSSCLFFCLPASAAPEFWDPDPATVRKVDEAVAGLPNFKGSGCPAPDIREFGRYYGGFTDAEGHRRIVGQLRSLKTYARPLRPGTPPEAEAGIHIVRAPIAIADGGCSVANVWFEADTLKLVQAVWGGR